MRFRAIACAFSQALTGIPGGLNTLPARKDLHGIGISDAEAYATVLRQKASYKNTFLHTEPFLNIEHSADFELFKPLDFIVCSDVIEHTLKPTSYVINNFFHALAPGGFLLLSAPTYEMETTVERYPTLKSYEVRQHNGKFSVKYATLFETEAVDDAPIFHGGPGQVLEMRVISHAQLLQELRATGFALEEMNPEQVRPFGAVWPARVERSDVPYPMIGSILIARKPLSA